MSVLVFDIGGTKTRVGVSANGTTLDKVRTFATPANPSRGLSELKEAMEILAPQGVSAIAGGIRGILREDKDGLDHDVILSDWENISIVDMLAKKFNVPVYLENDTALAGLGEATFGAGKGIDLVVYHSISTGVGGVKLVSGHIDVASVGFEPGHQVLDIDRTILGDDIAPTLENLVSGRAIEKRMGMKPYEIPQDDVMWDEIAGYLAQGLRNSILYWSPEVIILGGSMMIGNPKISLEAVRRAVVAVLDGVVPCPYITTAVLADEAGLYGALALLQQK